MFFKKGLQPRKFHYEPWFWDPETEEFNKRVKDAKRRYHGTKDDDYKPERAFRFSSSGTNYHAGRHSRYETNYGKVSPTRLLFLIALLGGLVYFLFFW